MYPVNDLRGTYVGTVSKIHQEVGTAFYLAELKIEHGINRRERFEVYLNIDAWEAAGVSLGARVTGACEVVCRRQDILPDIFTTVKLLTVSRYESIGPDRLEVHCIGKLVKGPELSNRFEVEVLTGIFALKDSYDEEHTIMATAYRHQREAFRQHKVGDVLRLSGNLHQYRIKMPPEFVKYSNVRPPPVYSTELSLAKVERYKQND